MPSKICEINPYMSITQDVLISSKNVQCNVVDERLDLSEEFIGPRKKF